MFPNEVQFLDFLRKAHVNTYAATSNRSRVAVPSRLGSTEYRYVEGDLLYVDIYFGNRTFIGEEVVYYKGEPVWAMNYRGSLAVHIEKSVGFDFLRKALLAGAEAGEVLRGSKSWKQGELEYGCDCESYPFSSHWALFSGVESIFRRINNSFGGIYHCVFHGGVIQK